MFKKTRRITLSALFVSAVVSSSNFKAVAEDDINLSKYKAMPIRNSDGAYVNDLHFEWTEGSRVYSYNFSIDENTHNYLLVTDVSPGKNPRKFVQTLKNAGAVLNDRGTIPAFYITDSRNGNILRKEHYFRGKLQDPDNNTPAVQFFSDVNGTLYKKEHYTDGKLQDPFSGEPAVQEYCFDEYIEPCTIKHYKQGFLNDPDNNTPAVQELDPKDGSPVLIAHYKNGLKNDPADKSPAVVMFNWDTGKVLEVKHYSKGLLHDPNIIVPAIQTFNSDSGQVLIAFSFSNGNFNYELNEQQLAELNTFLSSKNVKWDAKTDGPGVKKDARLLLPRPIIGKKRDKHFLY